MGKGGGSGLAKLTIAVNAQGITTIAIRVLPKNVRDEKETSVKGDTEDKKVDVKDARKSAFFLSVGWRISVYVGVYNHEVIFFFGWSTAPTEWWRDILDS